MSKKHIKSRDVNKFKGELPKIHEFLFDNAHDIILYLSEDGEILTVNKMAIKKYCYTYDELTSMNIHQLRHSSMDSDYIDQMALSECEGIVFEGIHVKKNGTPFPVEVSSKTVTFNNDKFRIHIIRDTTERKKIYSKILHLASYDTLTNIANRANILSQLDEAIKLSKITGNNMALMIFDLDKFKIINDTFGHPVGDIVLKHVAQTVKELLRTDDAIGRLGGDEFVIIQRNIRSENDVVSLITRIFNIFESPTILENNTIKINISIGICLLSQAKNRDQLIHQADSAMYEAKKTTGCSFEFYNNIKNSLLKNI